MDPRTNNYYQKKITRTLLSNETITEVEFEECEFKDCNFINSKFEKCKFINCKFNSCMLSNIDLTDSHFLDVEFVNSKGIGIDWTKTKRVQNINFENCQLNYSNFALLKLIKIKMIACEAKEVDFTETDLTECDFTDTDFERSIFSKTILTKANFKGAKNYYIDVRFNTTKKAHFSLPEALSLFSSLDVYIDYLEE